MTPTPPPEYWHGQLAELQRSVRQLEAQAEAREAEIAALALRVTRLQRQVGRMQRELRSVPLSISQRVQRYLAGGHWRPD